MDHHEMEVGADEVGLWIFKGLLSITYLLSQEYWLPSTMATAGGGKEYRYLPRSLHPCPKFHFTCCTTIINSIQPCRPRRKARAMDTRKRKLSQNLLGRRVRARAEPEPDLFENETDDSAPSEDGVAEEESDSEAASGSGASSRGSVSLGSFLSYISCKFF